jgi:hypothetical protein
MVGVDVTAVVSQASVLDLRAAAVLLAGAVTSFAEHIEENHAVRLQPDAPNARRRRG